MKSNTFSKLSGKGMKFAIVVARFNSEVTKKLEDGAQRALREAGVKPNDVSTHYVPGSFELPLTADLIASKKMVDAIICLGAIIRGETPHHAHLARAVTLGIMEINLKRGLPVILGVLTTNNLKQALNRVKPDKTNNGYGAAKAAIEMVHALRAIQ